MQHVVNEALTHAGNHRHGCAGHNKGRGRAQKAADVDVFRKTNPQEGQLLVHSLKLELYRSPEPVMVHIE